MRSIAPGAICAEAFFTSCYTWDRRACTTMAKPIIEGCMVELKAQIPDSLDAESGGLWGGKIGECAGERLVEVADEYLEVSDECFAYMEKNHGVDMAEQLRREAAAAKQ